MKYKKLLLELLETHLGKMPVYFKRRKRTDSGPIMYVYTEFINKRITTRYIVLQRINNEIDFAMALHELGHAIVETQKYYAAYYNKSLYRNKAITQHVLKEEFNAWKMAKTISPIWSQTMHDTYLECINAYVTTWQQKWKSDGNYKLLSHIFDLNNSFFFTTNKIGV